MRSSLARSLAVTWLALACGEAPASDAVRAGAAPGDLVTSAPSSAPASANADVDIASLGYTLGARDAPVRIIEMSDYGCGYCRGFHQDTWPVLRTEFVDAGKAQWKFLPFVSGMFKNSEEATRAAECVLEQGGALFEAMNNRIWTDQKEWKGSARPAPILRGYAGEAGADLRRYDSCLSENRRGARVSQATAVAHQVGVRATPTFFILGYQPLQGALPIEAFRQVLEMVYADATGGGSRR